jgi:hypothetical protein
MPKHGLGGERMQPRDIYEAEMPPQRVSANLSRDRMSMRRRVVDPESPGSSKSLSSVWLLEVHRTPSGADDRNLTGATQIPVGCHLAAFPG